MPDHVSLALTWRPLVGSPLSATILFIIAVAVGINALVFSFVDHVILRGLPYSDPVGVVVLTLDTSRRSGVQLNVRQYDVWRRGSTLFEGVGAFRQRLATLNGIDEPARLPIVDIAPEALNLLGVAPIAGRSLRADDAEKGAPPVVVVSHAFRRSRFGNTDSIGQVVDLDGVSYTVVGVMPQGFHFPADAAALWRPLILQDPVRYVQGRPVVVVEYLDVLARLRRGVTRDQAEAEGRAILNPSDSRSTSDELRARVTPLHTLLIAPMRQPLLLLQAAAAIMLIATVLLIAQLLAIQQAASRQATAILAALGAPRRVVLDAWLLRASLLGISGGICGTVLAAALLPFVRSLAPPELPNVSEVGIDFRVAGVSVLVAWMIACLAAANPFLRDASLWASGTCLRGLTKSDFRTIRTMRSMSIVSVAVAMALAVNATLLAWNLVGLLRTPLGFEPSKLMSFEIALPERQYADTASRERFWSEFLGLAREALGTHLVAAASGAPLASAPQRRSVGLDVDPAGFELTSVDMITPGYFRTIGALILDGREATDSDGPLTQPVVVVSRLFALRRFGRGDVVGERIRIGQRAWVIVGISDDIRHGGPLDDDEPHVFVPLAQASLTETAVGSALGPVMHVFVRSDRHLSQSLAVIRTVLRNINPSLPIGNALAMSERVTRLLRREVFSTLLFAVFSGLSILLATAGIYAAVGFGVRSRYRDYGIRMAVGASMERVERSIVLSGVRCAMVGVALGLPLALAVSTLVERAIGLHGGSFTGVAAACALGILAIAAWAAHVPARRLRRLDIVAVLRTE